MPDFQEYHALRRVRDAKLLCHGLPHYPHDPVASIDDERDRIPLRSWDFTVHEEVLQLADPRRAKRPEAVPRAAASYRERQLQGTRGNPDFPTSAYPLSLTRGRVVQVLRADDNPLGYHLDL